MTFDIQYSAYEQAAIDLTAEEAAQARSRALNAITVFKLEMNLAFRQAGRSDDEEQDFNNYIDDLNSDVESWPGWGF